MTTLPARIDPSDFVGSGRRVEARYVTGDGIHGKGVVIAYYEAPTVLIRRSDGSTFTWIAALVQPASGGQS